MRKRTFVLLIAAVCAGLIASPLPRFVELLLYVGVYQGLFPSTISWDAKNAFAKCTGAIADPRLWPQSPAGACQAMHLCANEAVLTGAQRRGLYAQISNTPGCPERDERLALFADKRPAK
jgi:hypothetical protein